MVKSSVKKAAKPDKTIKDKGKQKESANGLLDEILRLGGEEADLQLLDGIDAGSEEDEMIMGDAQTDKKLASELRSFVKGLDFNAFANGSLDVEEEEPPKKRQKVEAAASAEPPAKPQASVKPIVPAPQPVAPALKTSGWLVEPNSCWHALDLPALPEGSTSSLTSERKGKLRARAEQVLDELTRQYTDALSPNAGRDALPTPLTKSDKVFLSNVLSSGTSSDRLSALALITSSSPLHASAYLGQLLSLCSKKSRDEALRALQSVSEWLRSAGGGLPERKLVWFDDREDDLRRVDAAQKGVKGGDRRPGDEWLAVWLFEDRLKKWYLDLLRVIETLLRDPLPYARTRALAQTVALLTAKPEQEHNLLILAASLLSDSDRGVASKASHLLLELLSEHSLMKAVVVREVAAIVLKPATDAKAVHGRYYGLVTLNQVLLRSGEEAVANKLLDVYFKVFGDVLTEEEARLKGSKGKRLQPTQHDVEVDSKLLAAVLTGINRAHPYAELDDEQLRSRLDTLYRITHHGAFGVSLQALTLVHRMTIASSPVGAAPDRFYRTLYESLLDPRLASASKHAMYLNLVFRCVRSDPVPARQAAFVKRLLQSLGQHQPPYICGVLRLLSELFALKPALRNMLTDPEAEGDEHFADAHDDEESDKAGSEQEEEVQAANGRPATSKYDPRKREPQYAGAEKTCLWDLVPLLSHYHPSVCLYASELLVGATSSNKGDMDDHALSAFLDRFAYREAKSKDSAQDGPKAFTRAKAKTNGIVVNTPSFASKKAENVPADQVFFHRFFTAKQEAQDVTLRYKDEDEPAADDAEASDLDEDEVWAAMRASAKGDPGFDLPEEDASDALEGEVSDEDFDYTSDEDDMALDALAAAPDAALNEAALDAFEDEEDEVEAADDGSESEDDLGLEDAEDIFGSGDEIEVPLPPTAQEAVAAAQGAIKGRAKKRKLKTLPLFASAEDWEDALGPDEAL